MSTVAALPPDQKPGLDSRQLAVFAVASGAVLLAVLPLLLALAGCGPRFAPQATQTTTNTKSKSRHLQPAYAQN